MFTRSVSPEQAPDAPTYLNIDFEGGDPVALDGERLSPADLLARLNKVLGLSAHSAAPLQYHSALGQVQPIRSLTGPSATALPAVLVLESVHRYGLHAAGADQGPPI